MSLSHSASGIFCLDEVDDVACLAGGCSGYVEWLPGDGTFEGLPRLDGGLRDGLLESLGSM